MMWHAMELYRALDCPVSECASYSEANWKHIFILYFEIQQQSNFVFDLKATNRWQIIDWARCCMRTMLVFHWIQMHINFASLTINSERNLLIYVCLCIVFEKVRCYFGQAFRYISMQKILHFISFSHISCWILNIPTQPFYDATFDPPIF